MKTPQEKRILRVLDYIHANPAADLSLDALADVAAMSRFHWHRVFRALTGETAAQAVRRLRMFHASAALVQTDQPVAQIARDVGYDSLASFTRAFSESFGMTPRAFRNRGELRPFTPLTIPEILIMFPVEIRSEPARKLAALPHSGPYHAIGHAFERLSALMATRKLFPYVGAMIAVYYDDPSATPSDKLRSHAGFELSPQAPRMAAPIETVNLPAGRRAVLTHTGPYAGLQAGYDQLYSIWLPKSGEEPADVPPFEVYLNSPVDTPPDKLVTEICLPLKG
ncbi:AraC family transcriptional regulator [Rhodobacter sp. Har01]|uniref:AraC family transcriptional regulator n=1 Tax=Rhodobacter sp. Har01 TaxID=2883999 RepID=UPI001D07C4D8|nr:AraC family transcriptional regulator [Rhodobacter sp. Har01]MCB6177883.1 AraC family transcriptional regulator [Rhodobacter sp. Har01]